MNNPNRYYVYCFYKKETNEIFYVGKGSEYRYKNVSKRHRNPQFNEIYQSCPCASKILYNHLTEDEAYRLEIETIAKIRQIPNNILVNVSVGGGGHNTHVFTEAEKEHLRQISLGPNNPNYGNYWTDEQKQYLREKAQKSGRYKGKNNPRAKKVMCIETGQIFDTMTDAAKAYGLKCSGSIYHAINYPNGIAAGLHWQFI